MKYLIITTILLLLSVVANAVEAPPQAQACVACHGQMGISTNPEWPSLAGQNVGYTVIQMLAFRDGRRESPLMAPFAKGLSDADIMALAVYYASQPSGVADGGNKELVADGERLSAYCQPCHGQRGSPIADEWPKLSGQHARYLQQQLALFKSGARVHSHMQAAVHLLSDSEFRALAAYYSQLKP